MATYREIVYFCNDKLKMFSNDSTFTAEHIIFLADSYRALLLDRRYRDARKGEVPRKNYQEICMNLIQVPAIPGTDCYGIYLRTEKKLPVPMNIGIRHFYPVDYFNSEHISYVPMERMPYVGHNRWLQNIIYITQGPDGYLYLKSYNPQFLYLKKIRTEAVFQNASEATKFLCSNTDIPCDILDLEFPIEDVLITPLVQMIVQDIAGDKYQPSDQVNNSKDDMSGLTVNKEK